MVDCEFVNIEKINNEERVKIINYVMEDLFQFFGAGGGI